MGVAFRHVDVFAERPCAGNGLIVVFGGIDQPAAHLLELAQELRQFETIYVEANHAADTVRARVFTVEEELPFAGHPVIGAGAAVHERLAPGDTARDWQFELSGRPIPVRSRRRGTALAAEMNQGAPALVATLDQRARRTFAPALAIDAADLLPLPLQVLSTGLPYLLVPVTADGLASARINDHDFGARLAAVGAKFVYVLDPLAREGRTWDNGGIVEDIATGSAAGPAAAYLQNVGLLGAGDRLELHQGRFVGRPSTIEVRQEANGDVWVGGPVAVVAGGTIDVTL
jgi:PhzF family phenazine biosynthesis protein